MEQEFMTFGHKVRLLTVLKAILKMISFDDLFGWNYINEEKLAGQYCCACFLLQQLKDLRKIQDPITPNLLYMFKENSSTLIASPSTRMKLAVPERCPSNVGATVEPTICIKMPQQQGL